MMCSGIPLSTHLLAITLTYMQFVASNVILSLVGIYNRVIEFNSAPDDWKIFDTIVNGIQWLLILQFLWTTISVKNNKRSLYTWLWCQGTITLVMVLRIPIVLKEIFPPYSEIYDIHPNICPIYCQIFAIYLIWLGIQLYRKITHTASLDATDDTAEPFGAGFHKTWNYFCHIHPGYGLVVLLTIETIGSLAVLIDEGYLMIADIEGVSIEILSPKMIDNIARSVRFLMGLWAIYSLIKSKQKTIHCCVIWILMYLCLYIVSSALFISALTHTHASDNNNEHDSVSEPDYNSLINMFHLVNLLTSITDLIFRLLILISVLCFIRKK